MIVIKNLTKVYKTHHREVRALDNVSFTLPDTGMIFIVGKSGSGKSTLLNMISGLDKFTSGRIEAGKNSLSSMGRRKKEKYLSSYIGYIFQDYRLIEDFTVRQNIELAADISGSGNQYYKYLKMVGLEELEDRYPKELSGGQKQRVAIARALIKNPKVILADEPTGNLDKATTAEILKLLKKVSRDTLVIIVSHNLRDADEYADRIIELSDGKVINDKSRVSGYSNDLSYDGGVIKLPHHKDLSEEEIGEVLRRAKYSKGIVQNTGGFVSTPQDECKDKKTKLKKNGMSIANLSKIFGIIFSRKVISKLVTVFLAAVILSVYYVLQAFSLYETDTAVLNSLAANNAYGVILQTEHTQASTEKLVGYITDRKISKLDEIYEGDMHRLYSQFMPTGTVMGDESIVSLASNYAAYYALMTYGTLNTTEEYAEHVLGVDDLEVLAGDLYDKDYGIVITDYTADCMIKFNPLKYKTYQDVIGDYSAFGIDYYINAVVKTNYVNEHESIRYRLLNASADTNLDNLALSEDYINYVSDITERYHITYSFSENYIDALFEFDKNAGYAKIPQTFFRVGNKNTGSASYVMIAADKTDRYGLGDGEMAMSCTTYEGKFGKKYTNDTLSDFKPLSCIFMQKESSNNGSAVNRMNVTVAKLLPENPNPDTRYIYVNQATYERLISWNFYTYSIYLDSPDAALEIVDEIDEIGFEIYAGKIGNVHFIERCINVFSKFFEVTRIFVLIACAFYLINFGIKSIRSNIYEIGVIKAMGGIRRDINFIFISQSLVIGVGILITSYFGMQIGAAVANSMFMGSLNAIVNANFYGIKAIDFYPAVALADIGVSLAVVVISAIISTKSIDRLNLISILKAKE